MKRIRSETKVLFDLLVGIFKFPIRFLLALFGKRRFGDAFAPLRHFVEGFVEPKFTVFLCVALSVSFLVSLFFSSSFFGSLLLYPGDILGIRFFSLITHGFLHASLMHLFGNLLIIYVFGRIVELEFGSFYTSIIYFFGLAFAGVFASLVNLSQGVTSPSLGASGAAMALVSAAVFFRPFYLSYVFLFPLPVLLIGWSLVYSDILGVLSLTDSNIGYFAHLGGFLSSFLTLFPFNKIAFVKGLLLNSLFLVILVMLYL